MMYWREKCPYCASTSAKNDLNNEKGFGTPLIKCPSCGNVFLHPDRLELAYLSEEARLASKNRMKLQSIWRAAFFGIIIFALLALLFFKLLSLQGDFWSYVALVIAAGISVYSLINSSRNIDKIYAEELEKSKKRMSVPGYREMLSAAHYDPTW